MESKTFVERAEQRCVRAHPGKQSKGVGAFACDDCLNEQHREEAKQERARAVSCGDHSLLEVIVSRDARAPADEWRVQFTECGRVSNGTIAGPQALDAIVTAFRDGVARLTAAQGRADASLGGLDRPDPAHPR